MKKTLLLAVLISVSTSVFGQYDRWIYDDEDKEIKVYLKSIHSEESHIDGRKTYVWFTWTALSIAEKKETQDYLKNHFDYEFPNGIPQNTQSQINDYLYARRLYVFSCEKNKFKSIQTIYYTSTEDVIYSYSSTESLEEWSYPIPGSIGELLFDSVCNDWIYLDEELKRHRINIEDAYLYVRKNPSAILIPILN